MKDIFKQCIQEFEEFDLPQGIVRKLQWPHFPPQVRKAVALIGMRRSGKTWILYQHIQELLKKGVPRNHILYINFEDERLRGAQSQDLQSLLDAYFELYPDNIKAKLLYFHFDEIQTVPGWEQFVRRLLDSRQMEILLSGSSAKLLSKEIATELRGRAISREVFPFNFSEYLHYYSVEVDVNRVSAKQRAVILHHLGNYLLCGGFPETLGASDWIRREILQSYVQIVVARDIVERYNISAVAVLERWIRHCFQNIARPLSINKVYNDFRSLGLQVSKNSLYEWLGYVEDAYCLFALGCFDRSERKSSLKPKKIYAVDSGLIEAYAIDPAAKGRAAFENAVFRSLREMQQDIYYYVTKQGYEVDFLVQATNGQISLYQAAVTLKDPHTRIREVRALEEAMAELGLDESVIVTKEEEEKISTAHGEIRVIPAWKFFLQNDQS